MRKILGIERGSALLGFKSHVKNSIQLVFCLYNCEDFQKKTSLPLLAPPAPLVVCFGHPRGWGAPLWCQRRGLQSQRQGAWGRVV